MKKIFEKEDYKALAIVVGVLACMFVVGQGANYLLGLSAPVSATVSMQAENWGLGFGAEGSKPTGNASSEALKEYDAYYVGNDTGKALSPWAYHEATEAFRVLISGA